MREKYRKFIVEEMVEAGELIKHGDQYEDMGGQMTHESHMNYIVDQYIGGLSSIEKANLANKINQTFYPGISIY